MGATNQPSAHIAIATSCVSTMAHNRGAAGNGGMKNPRWVRVTNSRRVPNRPKNIGRFRSDGDDPEGADSKDRRNAISEDRRSSLPLFSIPPHKGDRIQFIPVLPSSAIVFATEPSCLSWLHLLRSWSLRSTWSGSICNRTQCGGLYCGVPCDTR